MQATLNFRGKFYNYRIAKSMLYTFSIAHGNKCLDYCIGMCVLECAQNGISRSLFR